jgi:steroid delta-isomerase-like uncharacterized protein
MFIRSGMLAIGLIMISAGPTFGSSVDDNKAVVEGFVAVGNSRELDRLVDFVADDFVRHCQATPDLDIRSRDQFRAFMEADIAVFPDSQVKVEQLVAEGDRVAIWATYSGTQEGHMGTFPPSGKAMSLDFGAIFRLHDGKIVELWVTWDNMAALAQLGHFPPPEAGEDD